jgi:hypothetical protein
MNLSEGANLQLSADFLLQDIGMCNDEGESFRESSGELVKLRSHATVLSSRQGPYVTTSEAKKNVVEKVLFQHQLLPTAVELLGVQQV